MRAVGRSAIAVVGRRDRRIDDLAVQLGLGIGVYDADQAPRAGEADDLQRHSRHTGFAKTVRTLASMVGLSVGETTLGTLVANLACAAVPGTWALQADGRMVDPPHLKQARWILDRAGETP